MCTHTLSHVCRPLTSFEECEASVVAAVESRQKVVPQPSCDLKRRQLRIVGAINGSKLMSVHPVITGDAEFAGRRLNLRNTIVLLSQFMDPCLNAPFQPSYD